MKNKKKRLKAEAKSGKQIKAVKEVKAPEPPKASPAKWAVPALAVLVFVNYWNSFHGAFQFDDLRLIQFNFSLRDLTNWRDIFLYERFRPLLMWTFALNHRVGELDPFSYHVFNVVFHAMAVVLFYLFLSRQNTPRWLPAIAAALMAVHPLNTESVSYVASRSTVLCSIFYFSALLFLDSYLRSSKKRFAAGYFLCFILGATVKEEAAMIPIVAFLYQWLFYGRDGMRKNLWLNITGGVILATAGAFRVAIQLQHTGALPYAMSTWIPTEMSVWLRYLRLAFFPAPLNIDPDIRPSGFESPLFWVSALVIGGLCVAAWRARKTNPFLAFWLLWYLLNLLPSSTFPLPDFMAEHRAYISNFGFVACVGYLLTVYRLPRIRPDWMFVGVLFFLLTFCSIATIRRNKVWATEVTLWQDSARKSPQKTRPRLNLGGAYMKQLDYDRAIPEFRSTLALSPNIPLAYSGLGVCYLRGKGDIAAAEGYFKKALEIQPDLTDAKTGLATVYFRQRRYPEALRLFEQVYPERQESIEVVAMMAESYLDLRAFDRAIVSLKRGIELDPKTPGWYFNLMDAYFQLGKYQEASQVYDQYGPLFANDPKFRRHTGQMLLGMKRALEGAKLMGGS